MEFKRPVLMRLLETQVHQWLKDFLRQQKNAAPICSGWPHHLTMARLISRSLRLKRSALIQTGSSFSRYCLSYLAPALLSNEPICLVVPYYIQNWLIEIILPRLCEELLIKTPIFRDPRHIGQGLIVATTKDWLELAIVNLQPNILTIIDQADQLEDHLREILSVKIALEEWLILLEVFDQEQDLIQNTRAKLTHSIFTHPENPYNCYLLEDLEYRYFMELLIHLKTLTPLPRIWQKFEQQAQSINQATSTIVDRVTGYFTLQTTPLDISSVLGDILRQQPIVLISGFLDLQKDAQPYRSSLKLGDILPVNFSPNRHTDQINLYIPRWLPLPNTPEFQAALLREICCLVKLTVISNKILVIIVEDVPLRAQIASVLAAEYGTRVQVESFDIKPEDGILITSWEFWISNQRNFSIPFLLIMATLPIPSPENPLVAAQISYHKKQKQDWFRLYLLPETLKMIQRVVIPLRESNSTIALLDTRVSCRSYGSEILEALAPYARIDKLDQEFIMALS